MAAQAPPIKVKDNEYINVQKVQLALHYFKRGLCKFIESEVQCLHEYLQLQIYGKQTKPLPLCCMYRSPLKRNMDTEDWELRVEKGCKSKCDDWFQKLLSLHIDRKSKKIYWDNIDMSSWPSKPWECAKVFMPNKRTSSSAGPDECNAQDLTMLLATCKHFHPRLSAQGHGLLKRISTIRDMVNQDDELKLYDGDKKIFIEDMIQLLEDDVSLKSREECKAAVKNICEIDSLSQSKLEDLLDCLSKGRKEPDLTDNINDKCGADRLTGDTDGKPQSMQVGDVVPRSRRIEICIPYNPRCGQINKWTAEDMEKCIGEQIGNGAFGTVYKAKITLEDFKKMPDGNKHEFVIKKIPITEEVNQKSYEREIDHGKILHPFINPVFARAESLQNQSKERYSYLMFPFMKNKDLRFNIDIENKKESISNKESNSKIWTRCIYQIVHAVDYLHTNLRPFRGLIFHRDLTSYNILLDENFNIRIGDFGIAVEAKLNASKATLTRKLGTTGYHPPNMNDEKYSASDDIFSIGVVMLEILTGEKAKLETGKKKYLYNKFDTMGELILCLDERANENEFAKWDASYRRDKIAEMAFEAVSLDETKRKAENILKKLEDLRVPSRECYRSSKELDVCVSCCVNTPVKLPLKGQECLKEESTDPCQLFCVYCLMNHVANPLMCPKHGKSRPPFGDHVYGIFVAGNDVTGKQDSSSCNHDYKTDADIFKSDVKKVVKTLTAMHSFKSASRKAHFKTVQPNCSGTEGEMMARIKQAFVELTALIRTALVDMKMKPEDRLSSSLFIFYFSGHCSDTDGLYLGSKREIINASTSWLMKMLHRKLRVDQVLVILDCCHADSLDFVHYPSTQDFNVDARQKVRIIQLSSCDTHEKSHASIHSIGSYFTHLLCQGLQGLQIHGSNNDVILCESCKKQNRKDEDPCVPCRWYHTQCSTDQTITLSRLVEFIRGHFKPLGDGSRHPIKMTLIHNAQGEINMCLGYYNPDQYHIPIRIFSSEGDHVFDLRKPYPEKIERLKQDIIKYTVEKQITCEVLCFHERYNQIPENTNKDATENTSLFVGIYAKYNSNMEMELNSVHRIYNAWISGIELEARVREKVEDLNHGSVKLNITKRMVPNVEIHEDCLKLSSDMIQIPADKIAEAERQIIQLFDPDRCQDFIYSIRKVLSTCKDSLSNEQKKEKVLYFLLHETFSVLKLV